MTMTEMGGSSERREGKHSARRGGRAEVEVVEVVTVVTAKKKVKVVMVGAGTVTVKKEATTVMAKEAMMGMERETKNICNWMSRRRKKVEVAALRLFKRV